MVNESGLIIKTISSRDLDTNNINVDDNFIGSCLVYKKEDESIRLEFKTLKEMLAFYGKTKRYLADKESLIELARLLYRCYKTLGKDKFSMIFNIRVKLNTADPSTCLFNKDITEIKLDDGTVIEMADTCVDDNSYTYFIYKLPDATYIDLSNLGIYIEAFVDLYTRVLANQSDTAYTHLYNRITPINKASSDSSMYGESRYVVDGSGIEDLLYGVIPKYSTSMNTPGYEKYRGYTSEFICKALNDCEKMIGNIFNYYSNNDVIIAQSDLSLNLDILEMNANIDNIELLSHTPDSYKSLIAKLNILGIKYNTLYSILGKEYIVFELNDCSYVASVGNLKFVHEAVDILLY